MTKSKKKHLKLRALDGERGIGCKLSNVGAIAKDRDANGSRSRRRGGNVECFREDFFERTCFLSKSIVRVLYYGFFFFVPRVPRRWNSQYLLVEGTVGS